MPTTDIQLTPTPSSQKIHAYGYDPETKRLAVQFKRWQGKGDDRISLPPIKTYEYLDVPAEKFAALEAAESKGSFINAEFAKPEWKFDRLDHDAEPQA